jgi:hypothetical protein
MNKSRSSSSRHNPSETRVDRLIGKTSRFDGLLQQVARLKAIKSALWPHVPEDLKPHCDLANYRSSTLVFVARTPLWASKLRHTSPQILHAARHDCKIKATRIDIRIDPGLPEPPPPGRKKVVSARTAEHLKQAAEASQDDGIRASLSNIAKRRR